MCFADDEVEQFFQVRIGFVPAENRGPRETFATLRKDLGKKAMANGGWFVAEGKRSIATQLREPEFQSIFGPLQGRDKWRASS